jgi:hypothetical protein
VPSTTSSSGALARAGVHEEDERCPQSAGTSVRSGQLRSGQIVPVSVARPPFTSPVSLSRGGGIRWP